MSRYFAAHLSSIEVKFVFVVLPCGQLRHDLSISVKHFSQIVHHAVRNKFQEDL